MPRFFPQFIHSSRTVGERRELVEKLNESQQEIRELRQELTLLRRNVDDLEEKHSRRLNSLRAQLQQRKAGKFGPEDAPQSTNGEGLTLVPTAMTHDEIEALARERGKI